MANDPHIQKPRQTPDIDAFDSAFADLDLFDEIAVSPTEEAFISFSITPEDSLDLISEVHQDLITENAGAFSNQEPEIQLILDMGEGDWDAFCQKAGNPDRAQAIGRVFDSLNITQLFDNITDICGSDAMKKLRRLTFEIIPEDSGAYAGFSATLGEIGFEYINGSYQPVFRSMEFSGTSRIVLPILSAADGDIYEINRLRETVTEEILHVLMCATPQNEFIDEGLAGAAINLMIERGHLNKSRYTKGVELISGFDDSGLNPGDGRAAHNNSMHSLIHAAGTVAILESLGSGKAEVADNFKLLFKACQGQTKGIKYEDWISRVDSHVPGFKSRYESHRLNRPLVSGDKIAFVQTGISDSASKESGYLYVCAYERNLNFRRPKFNIPNNTEPSIHNFDFEPGNVQFGSFLLDIKNKLGNSITLKINHDQEGGSLKIDSKRLKTIFSQLIDEKHKDAYKFTGKKVHLSVSADDDNWFRLGKGFFVPRV